MRIILKEIILWKPKLHKLKGKTECFFKKLTKQKRKGKALKMIHFIMRNPSTPSTERNKSNKLKDKM